MRHLTSAFQEAHMLIDEKKWPVLHCARGDMNPASLIALTHRRRKMILSTGATLREAVPPPM